MTDNGKDTIDNAEQHDQQPSHEAVKERLTALKTVKNGDEIIAPNGNPAGLTISIEHTENLGLPPNKRSPISGVPTMGLHNPDDCDGYNPLTSSVVARIAQGVKRVDLFERHLFDFA